MGSVTESAPIDSFVNTEPAGGYQTIFHCIMSHPAPARAHRKEGARSMTSVHTSVGSASAEGREGSISSSGPRAASDANARTANAADARVDHTFSMAARHASHQPAPAASGPMPPARISQPSGASIGGARGAVPGAEKRKRGDG